MKTEGDMDCKTVQDCNLNGSVLECSSLSGLCSDDIEKIVGCQMPGDNLDDATDYDWKFCFIPLNDLKHANEYGEEPEGGWKAAYLRHKQSDQQAVDSGSPEYAGREQWLKHWCQDTRIYPIFVVKENDEYRILDGYHRLAGAFWFGIDKVACFVGCPKP